MESQKQHHGHLQFSKILNKSRCENGSFKFMHNDGDEFTDSGYNSYHLITPNTSSSVQHHNNVSNLSPIKETKEFEADVNIKIQVAAASESKYAIVQKQQQPVVYTPTTQSIQRMLSLHLTTPKENVLNNETTNITFTTPKKTSNKPASLDCTETPSQCISPLQKSLTANITPRKMKKSFKRKGSGFREKLYSEENSFDSFKRHCSDENYNNGVVNSFERKSAARNTLSPIKNSNILRENMSSMNKSEFNIASSTPKNVAFQADFYSVRESNNSQGIIESGSAKKRSRVIRKFQSFSPSKIMTTQTKDATLSSIKENFEDKRHNIPVANKRNMFVRQSALCLSNESDKIGTCTPGVDSSIGINNPEVSMDSALFETSTEDNNTVNNGLNVLINAPIIMEQCTPTKKNITNSLIGFPSSPSGYQVSDAIIEKDRILYPELPRSPPKDLIKPKNVLKRLNSNKKPINRTVSSSGKKPIYSDKYSRKSYDGTDRLNIIKRLYKHEPTILETIFSYLNDGDILNLSLVSKIYSNIIQENRIFRDRRQRYLSNIIPMKENQNNNNTFTNNNNNNINVQMKTDSYKIEPANNPRQPFKECNHAIISKKNTVPVDISPPVSPSRRKFRKNQKIVSKLSRDSKIARCPRCDEASEVFNVKMDIGSPIKISSSIFTRSNSTLGLYSCFGDIGSPIKPLDVKKNKCVSFDVYNDTGNLNSVYSRRTPCRNLFSQGVIKSNTFEGRCLPTAQNTSILEYAKCCKRTCQFKFCMKCLCQYEVNHSCREFNSRSPSKEDEIGITRTIICSKQSKKALKRLCK